MFDEQTTEGVLEYRVATVVRGAGTEFWIICPATGQAIGPFATSGWATRVRDLLSAAAIPRSYRRAFMHRE